MESSSEISISALREIINSILQHIEQDLGITKVQLDKDLYWEVPTEQLYNPRVDPKNLELGQLYEDWEFLQNILKDKNASVSLMLTKVAPLLRYIGEKVGQ